MRRFRTVAAGVAALAAAATLAPSQAHAAGNVYIYKIHYDSPGSDRGGNSSLNAEYVQIKNTTGAKFQMQGYTVRDAAGHTYTFPAYRISPGKTVKVHTGKGTKSPGHLYMGRGWYVWNNDKDTATLRRPGGSFRDSCAYDSTRVDYKMC